MQIFQVHVDPSDFVSHSLCTAEVKAGFVVDLLGFIAGGCDAELIRNSDVELLFGFVFPRLASPRQIAASTREDQIMWLRRLAESASPSPAVAGYGDCHAAVVRVIREQALEQYQRFVSQRDRQRMSRELRSLRARFGPKLKPTGGLGRGA